MTWLLLYSWLSFSGVGDVTAPHARHAGNGGDPAAARGRKKGMPHAGTALRRPALPLPSRRRQSASLSRPPSSSPSAASSSQIFVGQTYY